MCVCVCVSNQLLVRSVTNPGDRCSSAVGHDYSGGAGAGAGATLMRLPPSDAGGRHCAVHELLHTLGFFHEHVRPDRDGHIDVDWDQIQRQRGGEASPTNIA